jgi:hypothetical protein
MFDHCRNISEQKQVRNTKSGDGDGTEAAMGIIITDHKRPGL